MKTKENGAEEENRGMSWLMFLNFKGKNFNSINISVMSW